MSIKGVTTEEEKIILDILSSYTQYDFYYYGSRVKGNFRAPSDLDIYIESPNGINPDDIEDLKEAFDESRLPYVVNFSYNIDEKFYNLIKNDFIKVEI